MTSPRPNRTKRLFFHTPQPNRVRHMQFNSLPAKETKIDTSQSILHRVRERNIRKQKPIKRGHIFDDDDDDEEDEQEDENTVPPTLLVRTCSDKSNLSEYKMNVYFFFCMYMLQRQQSAPIQKRRKRHSLIEARSDSDDDNLGLDLGIFDDGPDLSDMSEIDE